MSRRRRERGPEPGLFDLPLDGPGAPEEPARPPEAPGEPAGAASAPSLPLDEPPARRAPEEPPRAEPVPLSARFLAGLADLAVHLAVAVALLFGARLLGVPAGLGDGAPLLLFLLIFSFLYTVIPLAFWSQTPGMAWVGLAARTPAGETLTFGQTALRWLGGLLSVLLLGLPVLPALAGGRSLADRLSGSVTRAA